MRNLNRKTLYITLIVIVVFIFTLTISYAALSVTLKITGNTEVTASNWQIYLDNPVVKQASTTTNLPTITSNTTATFTTTLSIPGDFYEFTIDIVNDGDIDAMIESITKTGLTENQKKYLNYIIEYQNGEIITNKQLLSANSFVRLIVRLEYRTDINASDLPSVAETVRPSFTINYTQRDESETTIVPDNGVKYSVIAVSGDGTRMGDQIKIADEYFYVVNNDGTNTTLFARYGLQVGDIFTESTYDNSRGLQEKLVSKPVKYTMLDGYYTDYKAYLESQGATINEIRTITGAELTLLGCDLTNKTCANAPSWLIGHSFWTSEVYSAPNYQHYVASTGQYSHAHKLLEYGYVRPIIVIPSNIIHQKNQTGIVKIDKGTGTNIGDRISIGNEFFRVLSNSNGKLKMISEYFISSNGTNIITFFSSTNYWHNSTISYTNHPYVYNSNSLIYPYLQTYKQSLENQGVIVEEIRLLSWDELKMFNCRTEGSFTYCHEKYYWIKIGHNDGAQWLLGSASSENKIDYIYDGKHGTSLYSSGTASYIRPVIIIPSSSI